MGAFGASPPRSIAKPGFDRCGPRTGSRNCLGVIEVPDMNGMPMRFSRIWMLGLVGAALALSGCSKSGPTRVNVKGTVSHNGQRLSSGMLQFTGASGFSAAVIQPDGTFTITDVLTEEVKVSVMDTPQSSGSSSLEKTAAPQRPPVQLPEKFRHPEQSGVKYTITEQTKELDIDLK